MTNPVGPSGKGRRRIWIAAASVGGIVVATTAVGAVQLSGKAEPSAAGSRAVAPAAGNAPAAQAARITLPRVKWKVSWHDEFRGRGKPAKWWRPVTGNGTNGWSHKALHYYRAGNAAQDGKGRLFITAAKTGPKDKLRCWNGKCKYTSARIQTSGTFKQAYGRFAIRAKLPTGKGVWPAFWMQRAAKPYGEIDVVETIGSKPNLVQGYAHQTRRVGGGTTLLRRSLAAGYHTYGVDWTPSRVVWWVDGHPYAQLKRYKGWVFNSPFYLILNIQVGGQWPGTPNSATRFPARMAVDWVRVYKAAK